MSISGSVALQKWAALPACFLFFSRHQRSIGPYTVNGGRMPNSPTGRKVMRTNGSHPSEFGTSQIAGAAHEGGSRGRRGTGDADGRKRRRQPRAGELSRLPEHSHDSANGVSASRRFRSDDKRVFLPTGAGVGHSASPQSGERGTISSRLIRFMVFPAVRRLPRDMV
mgnify:CR=1 FL=1